ncbi:MAG: dihydroneopterin triphosphate diphosphatase [Candidatus Thiodiazotropha sp.]
MKKANKRPESVLVVVYTAAGEVLMLRRTRPRDFWQSVTGSLEWGESAAQAARRELYEETGILVGDALVDLGCEERFPILPAWRSRYGVNVHTNREHWFAVMLPFRRQPRLHPKEHAECCWVPYTRALRLATSWTNRKAIRRIFDSV